MWLDLLKLYSKATITLACFIRTEKPDCFCHVKTCLTPNNPQFSFYTRKCPFMDI